MGMSASQARLLSLTTRLSSNELRSQTITDAKLRLAESTQAANKEYMNALNSTQLNYTYYNDNGESTQFALTPGLIYEYSPLKNQYALINNAGKPLVSALDATNYKETDGLVNFLRRYNLVDDFTTEETVTKTRTETVQRLNPEWEDWKNKYDDWKNHEPDRTSSIYQVFQVTDPGRAGLYDDFLDATKICYSSTMLYFAYRGFLPPQGEFKDADGTVLAKYDLENNKDSFRIFDYQYLHDNGYDESNGLEQIDNEWWISSSVLDVSTTKDCYAHVLAHLLEVTDDNSMHFPSAGFDSLEIMAYDEDVLYGGAYLNQHWWNGFIVPNRPENIDSRYDKAQTLAKLFASKDADGFFIGNRDYLCYGDQGREDVIDTHSSEFNQLSEEEKLEKVKKMLMSDFYYDYNANEGEDPIKVKSIYQKVVDLLDLFVYSKKENMPKGYDVSDKELFDAINHFVYKDLAGSMGMTTTFDEERFNEDYEDWKNNEPTDEPEKYINEETTVEYEEVVSNSYMLLNDKDKSQWYTNLWYIMNGSDSANLVTSKQIADENGNERIVFEVKGAQKSPNGGNYDICDENLINNSDWLQFAFEHGILSMRQAQYFNPSTDSEKVPELTSKAIFWNDIIYSTASDIVTTDNEAAITKAEVKYKKVVSEIERKDKKYDEDLRKLDTEHNALVAEYESLKNVISKNVDRSFKAFS